MLDKEFYILRYSCCEHESNLDGNFKSMGSVSRHWHPSIYIVNHHPMITTGINFGNCPSPIGGVKKMLTVTTFRINEVNMKLY